MITKGTRSCGGHAHIVLLLCLALASITLGLWVGILTSHGFTVGDILRAVGIVTCLGVIALMSGRGAFGFERVILGLTIIAMLVTGYYRHQIVNYKTNSQQGAAPLPPAPAGPSEGAR